MVAPRRDYDRSEAEVRGAWHASIGCATETEIRERAHCSAATAFRVANLRRGGSMASLSLWLAGNLTLRQVERIVTSCPFDELAQTEEASHTPSARRALLAR